MKHGLSFRMVVASGLLAVVIGVAFAVLLSSVVSLGKLAEDARQSEVVLVAANRLERLVVDVETGERGFLLTGREDFLQPWQAAQTAFPAQAQMLEGLVAGDSGQQNRARQITQAASSYINDYSIPLVSSARKNRAAAATIAKVEEGKARVDAIRADFDQFVATEQRLARTSRSDSDNAANRAVVAAAGGLAGSTLLIAGFASYLATAIVRPIRRVAATADRLAHGDLGARLPERGTAEIGVLQRSFNTMAGSLEETRDELAASRARIVVAADQARRRIERDLHDGIQQRLVSLLLDVRAGAATVPPELSEVHRQLDGLAGGLTGALDDLRELSRGIHPSILSDGGLAPALKALRRRSTVPVELTIDVPQRLPDTVEVGAYYVVSEALANAAKHARASVVHVDVQTQEDHLSLSIRDDGVGGADPSRGSGLIGLTDRVQTLGGTITITSPVGRGTTLSIEIRHRTSSRG
jgi:signal transduction histidine kinase